MYRRCPRRVIRSVPILEGHHLLLVGAADLQCLCQVLLLPLVKCPCFHHRYLRGLSSCLCQSHKPRTPRPVLSSPIITATWFFTYFSDSIPCPLLTPETLPLNPGGHGILHQQKALQLHLLLFFLYPKSNSQKLSLSKTASLQLSQGEAGFPSWFYCCLGDMHSYRETIPPPSPSLNHTFHPSKCWWLAGGWPAVLLSTTTPVNILVDFRTYLHDLSNPQHCP